MKKKFLALVLTLAMVLSLVPATALATDGPPDTTTDNVVYGHYTNTGEWESGKPENAIPSSLKDTVTTVDKTAEKVTDNQYKVTLKVEMKHKTTEVPPGAAATVLVIDTSGSMDDKTQCEKKEHTHSDTCYTWETCTPENHPKHYYKWKGEYNHKWITSCTWDGNKHVYRHLTCNKEEHQHNNCGSTTRIEAAKVAAKNFLNSYRGGTVSEDGTWTPSATPLERYVSIVSFNKYVSKNDWVDVSTQEGYDAAIASINALSADGGTNLDAGLRMANAQLNNGTVKGMSANVVVLTDGKPTYHLKKAENQNKNSDVEIEGVKYSVKGKGYETSSATYNQTVETAATLQQAASVYTVCFGASNERLEAEDEPTVSEFLKTNIATQQAEGQTYAYDANDTTDLYKAFAAISSSVVSGLKTGTVNDALPNGVSCTDGIFNEEGELTWQLDPEHATKRGPDSNGFITYTYEKTYKVQIDPAAENLNIVDGGYVPLNQPTTLTVQHNGSPVQIPFPIPAGKVTYSLTSFKKELVTEKDNFSNPPAGVTIPENESSTVTVGENGVTLLYKITVEGNAGAKFTVRDDGATLVSPTTITPGDNSTFSGAVGNTGETVFYVSKHFNIDADTESVSNTATIDPGDNANGPDNREKTVTTTVEKEKPTYTLTYDANGGKFDSENTKTETIDQTGDHALNYTSEYTPTYTSNDKNVIFLGWSTEKKENVLTKADVNDATTIASSIITEVNIPAVQTVYAVWSLDENGNNIPDVFEVTITYKIENGQWTDGVNAIGSDDITATFQLYKQQADHTWKATDELLLDGSFPAGYTGTAGYTGLGWYRNSETTPSPSELVRPTTKVIDAVTDAVTGAVTGAETVFTYKYAPTTPKTYTVVLHLEGGSYTTTPNTYTENSDGIYQYNVTKTDAVINPESPSRNNFSFEGWSLSKSAPQTLISKDATFARLYLKQSGINGSSDKIDLYAVWKEAEPPATQWDTSKSKTATNLDSNYESKVTLSLPSAEEKLDSDIVFVVDKSESSEKESALSMLDAIRNQIDKGTKVNVGVVTFNTVATQNGFFDLNADYEAIKEKFNAPVTSGTNLHAGILVGVDMLNKSSTDNNRKYLIVISDGITYTYDKDAKIVPYYWLNDGQPYFSKDPYSWNFKYGAGTTFTTDQWNTWRSKVENILKSETISPVLYSEIGTLTKENGVPAPQDGNYTSSVDRALYYSYLAYQSASEKYHCYAIPAHTSKESAYPYGVSFMGYLGGNKEASFNEIKNDILYLIDTGSYVEDYMGYVEGDYNFNFINDASKLTITVGRGDAQEKLDAVKIDDNHYGFGPVTVETDSSDKVTTYRYNLEYIPGNMTDTERFVWHINVPVENLAPVALTYSVKLVNPKSASGTYGQYDEDGSKNYSGLYTNNSATLHPKESNENWGIPENFLKPTVSYTVSGGSGGSHKPTVTIPDDVPTGLNGKDHYAYVVGYPDGMVYPQKNITRAEVATIFFRLLKDETREANMTKSNGYNDMKDGAWYTCAVSTLSKMGIIKGYEDGSFKPDASISRAEFAAIAARFDPDGDKTPATFSDVSSHWAKDEISIAANHGWIKGYEDGSFKPDQKITRAETMTLVNRVLKRLPETKDDLHKDMKTWPDNQKESAWFYLAVQEATNSHYQKLKKDGTHETWESMRETRDWAALEK